MIDDVGSRIRVMENLNFAHCKEDAISPGTAKNEGQMLISEDFPTGRPWRLSRAEERPDPPCHFQSAPLPISPLPTM